MTPKDYDVTVTWGPAGSLGVAQKTAVKTRASTAKIAVSIALRDIPDDARIIRIEL